MTLGRRILEDNGAKFKDKTIRNLKREMKGGAGTVDKVLTTKVIEAALKELDLKGRSMVLTAASQEHAFMRYSPSSSLISILKTIQLN